MEQTRLDLDAPDDGVAELETRAMKFGKQLDYSGLLLHETASKYLFFHDDNQILKQQLSTSIACDGEMELRLINDQGCVEVYKCASFESYKVPKCCRRVVLLSVWVACAAATKVIHAGGCCSFQIF